MALDGVAEGPRPYLSDMSESAHRTPRVREPGVLSRPHRRSVSVLSHPVGLPVSRATLVFAIDLFTVEKGHRGGRVGNEPAAKS